MNKQKITESEAAEIYGVRTNHERMPNGQLRFRLTTPEGNDYIRTVAGSNGAWQVAHFHAALQETYIVEKGWMALAEKLVNGLKIRVYGPKSIVTTRPTIAHNVYLPASAVIHAVKHGMSTPDDWNEDSKLTEETSRIAENDILVEGIKEEPPNNPIDQRFDGYISLYNNLDNLIWRIPGFLAAGAAILIGFAGTVISKDKIPDIPPLLLAGLFFIVGLLFFLSSFSMARIREHHTMAGEWLARMESDGYFHMRQLTVKRKWPLSAPLVFRWAYALLCVFFWVLAFVAVFRFQWLVSILKWTS